MAGVSLLLATLAAGAAPAAAGSGTTINVIAACFGGLGSPTQTQAGTALIDAMQAAQDGMAGQCAGLGAPTTPIAGPFTLILDPAYTYQLSSINNYTDGPDALPAVIDNVTIKSMGTQQAVIQAGQPGSGEKADWRSAGAGVLSGTPTPASPK